MTNDNVKFKFLHSAMLSSLLKNYNREDQNLIKAAYELAREAHAGQFRVHGEPYISHPIAVAKTLVDLKLDAPSVAAGLLHDVVEDTKISKAKIEKTFGKEIAFLVNGVTKLGQIKYREQQRWMENLRKMFFSMAKDIRVVLIKLADRLHNMRTLEALEKERRKKVALETLEIYAPLANRLGMGELKGDLEDLAFPYAYPAEYQWLVAQVNDLYQDRKAYIKELEPLARRKLKEEGIEIAKIHARAKHYYSLYKKLMENEKDLSKIFDLVALRIIVPTKTDCYKTLGALHNFWRPLPGRIKDYIALPKPNGYQSLHTTVFAKDWRITEIQIRTTEMHEEAEFGIAAHWSYKEGEKRKSSPDWVGQLKEWQRINQSSREFMESLQIDFFKNRIFVLTPKGDVLDLPEGATPIDFAYSIHTSVGHKTIGAKTDNLLIPLDEPLRNGQVVEIVVGKKEAAKPYWINIVKTSQARDKIKTWLKKHEKELDRSPIPPGKLLSEPKKKFFPLEMRILAKDRVGLVRDITDIICNKNINIINITATDEGGNGLVLPRVKLEVKTYQQFRELTSEIKKVRGVKKVMKI